jgi:O-antigen/teichoic acid export membrane protein
MFKPNILKNKRLVSEALWVAFGQVSSMLLGVMLIRILTEHLNPEEYGELSLILTLGILTCVIPSAYFLSGIERMYSMAVEKKEEFEYYTAIKKMAIKSGLLSLIILSLIFVVLKVGFPKYWEWHEEVFLATLFTIVSSFSTALTSIFNAARERSLVAFYIFIDSILRISLVLMLAYFGVINIYTILLIYVIGVIITLIMRYLSFLKKTLKPSMARSISSTSFSTQWKNKMYQYSKPFVYFQLFTWMHTSSDRWALEMSSSTESAGLLVVLIQVGYTPAIIFSGMLITYISPILYDIYGDGKMKKKIEVHNLSIKISYFILLITIIATMAAYFLHGFVFEMLTNERYHSVSYLLPGVVLSAGLFSIGQMLFTKLNTELRINEIVKPKIITALAGVFLNMIGAYFWGIEGVVFALIAFSVFYFIWMMHLSKYDKSVNSTHDF